MYFCGGITEITAFEHLLKTTSQLTPVFTTDPMCKELYTKTLHGVIVYAKKWRSFLLLKHHRFHIMARVTLGGLTTYGQIKGWNLHFLKLSILF